MSLTTKHKTTSPSLTALEKSFLNLWSSMYPDIQLQTQHKVIPNRRYRFDFAHVDSKVAIEIQGGIWIKSGHTTGQGLQSSYAKLNLASYHDWMVFQLSSDMISPTWLTIIYLAMVDRQKK
jgi:very-short-patch-repair endonuclease